MKVVKILLLVLVLAFIAIQFVPSGIPENLPEDERGLSGKVADESTLILLKTSCYDCHSNQTDFPWYSKIAPVSWWLGDHITDGKEHLNFSTWEDYSTREKVGLLEEILDEVKAGNMPLKSYLIIHKDAKLDENEISALEKWTEDLSNRLLE